MTFRSDVPKGRVGAAGVAIAVALPIVLWHRVVADIAAEFRIDATALGPGRGSAGAIALYLLGFALATQVAQIAEGLSAA